eukprot:760167-Pleurochrysis_carterae.AAC.1
MANSVFTLNACCAHGTSQTTGTNTQAYLHQHTRPHSSQDTYPPAPLAVFKRFLTPTRSTNTMEQALPFSPTAELAHSPQLAYRRAQPHSALGRALLI